MPRNKITKRGLVDRRGGKRPAAGRPSIGYSKKLALLNEVTLRQQLQPDLSDKGAISELQNEKMIRTASCQRYLTPKYIDSKIKKILQESNREGILSVLPRLTSEDKF